MNGECVYGIVDKGITIVNGELVIPQGQSEACVAIFDGQHRVTAAKELETEGHDLFVIPSYLFSYGTPASIWLPLAFARMELTMHSDGYTTIDLLQMMDIIVTERAENGLQPPTALQIQEAIYGKVLATDNTKKANLQLTPTMLVDFYNFYDRLKSNNLLNEVATLGSADHSIQAQKCRSLLDSVDITLTVFVEGVCFLAPIASIGRVGGH